MNYTFNNPQHKENFEMVCNQFPQVKTGDKEYTSAAYILALPIIFEKFKTVYKDFEYPVSWIIAWETKYNNQYAKLQGYTKEERDEIVLPDLTNAMVQLGKLAMHLWNSHKYFSLMDCLASLDVDNYRAALYAIQIRMGR